MQASPSPPRWPLRRGPGRRGRAETSPPVGPGAHPANTHPAPLPEKSRPAALSPAPTLTGREGCASTHRCAPSAPGLLAGAQRVFDNSLWPPCWRRSRVRSSPPRPCRTRPRPRRGAPTPWWPRSSPPTPPWSPLGRGCRRLRAGWIRPGAWATPCWSSAPPPSAWCKPMCRWASRWASASACRPWAAGRGPGRGAGGGGPGAGDLRVLRQGPWPWRPAACTPAYGRWSRPAQQRRGGRAAGVLGAGRRRPLRHRPGLTHRHLGPGAAPGGAGERGLGPGGAGAVLARPHQRAVAPSGR